MKKRLSFYFTSIGLLIISSIMLSHPTVKILFDSHRDFKSVVSNFSYIDKKTNKISGFEHIKLKQFDFYNPKKNDYEYFLNDYGKEYLIKRFQQSTIIGPEISALNYIVIGNNFIIKKTNLGEYYSISNSIFINISNILKQTDYKLWDDENQIELQKRRVESILSVVVHEYYHHLSSSYVSSPIGHPPHKPLDFSTFWNRTPNSNVKKTYAKINDKIVHKSIWNLWFYNKFKNLFFSKGAIGLKEKNELSLTLIKYLDYLKQWKDRTTNKNLIEHLNDVINAVRKIKNNQDKSIYNKFDNIKNIFEWANERTNQIIKNNFSDEEEIFFGFKFDYYTESSKVNGTKYIAKIPKLPIIYKTNYKQIAYLYSMEEQVVRKLLLVTFIPVKKYEKIMWEYYKNYMLTSNYIRHPEYNSSNYWKPFYTDNVYPSKSRTFNKSEELVKKIISPMMGYDNYSNLSFITSRDLWKIVSKSTIYHQNSIESGKDHKKIKIGGFTDNNEFNYVGYENDDGKIVKFSIQNKKFSIWHKNKIESEDKITDGKEKFYWYTNNFIDVDNILNKKLFFFKIVDKKVVEKKAFTSVRRNNFGAANNFNEGMIQNSQFVKKVMNKRWSEPGGKWLIVGATDSDGNVIIKYHKNQEEIEKIWKS